MMCLNMEATESFRKLVPSQLALTRELMKYVMSSSYSLEGRKPGITTNTAQSIHMPLTKRAYLFYLTKF